MITIPIHDADHATVRELHERMGHDYAFPDLSNSLVVVKQGVVDERGKLVGAAILRLQAETYLWLDMSLPVDVRYGVVLALFRAVVREAWALGIDSLVAYLPPNLPKTFKNLLTKLGWASIRAGWESWTKDIN